MDNRCNLKEFAQIVMEQVKLFKKAAVYAKENEF
jgi:hypothetical protein